MVVWRISTVIISSILRKIPLNRLALVPTLTINIFLFPVLIKGTQILIGIWCYTRFGTHLEMKICSQNVCLGPKFVNLSMILLPTLFFRKWDFLTSEQVQCWSFGVIKTCEMFERVSQSKKNSDFLSLLGCHLFAYVWIFLRASLVGALRITKCTDFR